MVVDDPEAVVQKRLLNNLDNRCMAIESKRMLSLREVEKLILTMNSAKPRLLWCNLTGVSTSSGTSQDRRRGWNTARLIQAQLNAGRDVVLIASARNGAWELDGIQQACNNSQLKTSLHRLCAYGVKCERSLLPKGTVLRCTATFELPSMDRCNCPQHARNSIESNVNSSFAALSEPCLAIILMQVLGKSVYWATAPATPALNRRVPVPETKPILKTKPISNLRTVNHNSIALTTICTERTRTSLSNLPDERTSTSTSASAYPTEARIRQKAKEKLNKLAGIDKPKRVLKDFERHYDDCGDDMTSIDVADEYDAKDDYSTVTAYAE